MNQVQILSEVGNGDAIRAWKLKVRFLATVATLILGLGGRMRKKDRNLIASLKKTIWDVRAKVYYGEVKGNKSIKDSLESIYRIKIDC